MRTPLTAIQGMTELLAKYDMDSARRKEISSTINGEVKRLASMISEYLDITRLESGATALRKTPARVEPMLQRVLLLLEPMASQRGIRLSTKLSQALPALLIDVDLLGRAVENLVSNSIKYSPGETEVLVTAVQENGDLVISVEDHGYGVPEADLGRVFDKFYRVPRVEDAGVPGTGLGLAFVREIAELHGGTVGITSKVNQGSTFTLRIPLGEETHSDSTLEK
jgi:signal transduction histidine kinase